MNFIYLPFGKYVYKEIAPVSKNKTANVAETRRELV